jgi:hypothetical protein
MNVVMPTGMITMHKDPELSAQSKKTAERGRRILASLSNKRPVKDNCNAILAVATDNEEVEAQADLVKVCVASVRNQKHLFLIIIPYPTLFSKLCRFASRASGQYWTEFFEKWGYKEQEKEAIARAIAAVFDN